LSSVHSEAPAGAEELGSANCPHEDAIGLENLQLSMFVGVQVVRFKTFESETDFCEITRKCSLISGNRNIVLQTTFSVTTYEQIKEKK